MKFYERGKVMKFLGILFIVILVAAAAGTLLRVATG